MSSASAGPWALLYRLGFAVFVIACVFNAVDAYTTYAQAENHLIQGIDPAEKLNEAIAFLGLAILLTIEGVGLIMYQWARRHARSWLG